MKRVNRFWLTGVCAIGCLLGAAHWLRSVPVQAQQNYGDSDDGNIYVYAWIDIDSSYILYTESYTVLDYFADENIDAVDDEMQVDEDQDVFFDHFADPDYYYSEYPPEQSNGPVDTGHEYGVTSIGWVCYDYGDDDGEGDGEGDDCYWYPELAANAPVYVSAPLPQVYSLSTNLVSQGDQGTLTVTGSNFFETSVDQLTANLSGGGSPFTLANAPSTCTTSCTATFSYNFSGYPAGTYNFTVTNNEGTSTNLEYFTVAPPSAPSPPPDPCAVTSNPQAGYTSIVSTGSSGGSGTLAVSFSGAAFAAVSPSVTYGPYSTPSSIASNIAALITKNYYHSGLSAKAFGPTIVYNGLSALGTVTPVFTDPSFTTNTSPIAGSEAQNACYYTAPPSSPICPTSVTLSSNIHEQPLSLDAPEFLTGVGILTEMDIGPVGGNFASAIITENVAPTTNTCPANIQAFSSFPTIVDANSLVFRIGGSAFWENFSYPGIPNAFYDSHRLKLNFDMLGATNATSRVAKATQVYKCNGVPIGEFFLTNTYSKGIINGQSVTYVDVTKQ